jgi:NAD(P)-dependent dehydrogenase (short-subunit alcohol dehydrogenase family)
MNQQKVALVTGVSSGIGRAILGLLPRYGFQVFGTTRGNGEANRNPADLELVRLDVRDEESVLSCVQTVLDRAGRIDALVNNAGYTPNPPKFSGASAVPVADGVKSVNCTTFDADGILARDRFL